MLTTLAFSQRGEKKHHQLNPELKKEMQSYIEKNVVPVLQTSQDEFDAGLSAEDLAFVQAKRAEVAKKESGEKSESRSASSRKKSDERESQEYD